MARYIDTDAASTAKAEGDGAPEVEITPAMIDAGVNVLIAQYDAIGTSLDRAAAEEIFKVMMAKRDSRPKRRI